MSPDPVDEAVLAEQARNAPLTRPRPGHADLAGMQKYGHDDARPVLERASARETAARVALGELARRFLRQALGIEIVSHVVAIGTVCVPDGTAPGPQDARADRRRPGPLPGPGHQRGDGARDRYRPQGRRYPRRRGRGPRLRGAAGPGQLRARRPAPGRAAGRGPDEHPGDQGRRGRRRLRDRPAPRVAGARRDRERPGRGAAADQPGRRDRGRDEHRRGDQGAGGDEADLHRAARAGHGGRAHRRGRPGRSTSAAT